ncbi:hypothetical protein MCOR28_006995 [Pyricularia oryzae]|uniref:Zn(2)-C6 fungal-type domain-containing protein n=1 Tax=Pyricularia grisea TaxID=148305 RepID=A0ABQ8NGQ0_PYRGI|nr:hypothetical protein MCOR33_007032 [Pyricularia grisea]KAI6339851.1 hypothetical protein MCOR28_006995 [Pyricularia oryzae]
MSASAKPRQPRLRASCDGCFLAKVKCSKARPICSRCLACGIECRYSPSTRAGKPKSDHNLNQHQNSSANDISGLSPVGDDKTMMFNTHVHGPGLYRIDTGWNTPPGVMNGLTPLLGVDERAAREAEMMAAASATDIYTASMPWTPPNDLNPTTHFGDTPAMVAPIPQSHHARSQSFDITMPTNMSQWTDHQSTHDMFGYSQTHIPTPSSMANYFPSPSSTPTLRPQVRAKAASTNSINTSGNGATPCGCFTGCLQSLQALHNASSPSSPPFDVVLALNRKAVDACATILACTNCMSRSGTHTAAMLIATVMGKITAGYKSAAQNYFDSSSPTNIMATTGGGGSNGTSASTSPVALSINSMSGNLGNLGGCLGVSLGAYQVNAEDGRWLELEILARELRKLEEVYARFRDISTDLSEDPEVSRVMISYLGQTLGSTVEVVVNHRKDNMGSLRGPIFFAKILGRAVIGDMSLLARIARLVRQQISES